jgi:peptide/nickel transport system substrate-binding protein
MEPGGLYGPADPDDRAAQTDATDRRAQKSVNNFLKKNLEEQSMKWGKIQLLAAAGLLLGCFACSQGKSAGGELRYGLTLVPSGIDPQINASSELGIPLASVYDTLVFRDAGGAFVPGLAERWEVAPDGLQYTFFLRRDVRFHDGTAFDARAVKVNLERVLNPEMKSQKARFMIDKVTAVTVVDDFTVRVNLSEPFAPLLDSLSQVYLGMASPAALEKWGPDYQFHQSGTGPFRFVEYGAGDHLTLERNPDYAWAPATYRNKSAALDRIVFRFYADPATRAPALLSGEVDVMGEVLPGDAGDLQKNNSFMVYPVAIPGQPLQFFFNLGRTPTDDLRVRKALLAATDRVSLVRTVFGSFSPAAVGPLTRATWGAAAVTPADAYDRAGAGALLAEAGWKDVNGDGIREKDGQPLLLTVVYPPWGMTPQTAELLEVQWKEIGAAVELVQAASFSALMEAHAGGSYHLISTNLAGTDPDLLRAYYHSDGAYNWTGFARSDLDAILDEAVRTIDPVRRLDLYRQAQAIIAEECLILPIRDYVNINIANSRVKGLTFSPQGWFPVLIDVEME